MCGLANSRIQSRQTRESGETDLTMPYQKTTQPHPGCSYLHRICLSCKFTIFKDDPDRFCPDCIFRNPTVSLAEGGQKFHGFSVVQSRVDVRKVLDNTLQNFEEFLSEYTDEKNFRLV